MRILNSFVDDLSNSTLCQSTELHRYFPRPRLSSSLGWPLDRLSTTPRICRYLKLFGGVAITFYAIEREDFCKCEFEHCFFRQSKWAVLHCAWLSETKLYSISHLIQTSLAIVILNCPHPTTPFQRRTELSEMSWTKGRVERKMLPTEHTM